MVVVVVEIDDLNVDLIGFTIQERLVCFPLMLKAATYQDRHVEGLIEQDNTDSMHDDNLDVVDLEASTPSSSTGKRLIGIDANTYSLEWTSSKTGAIPATLKIPKLEKLD
ncbi:unnamed protein product [Lactuca virosa]|uniref:Uncharacterized protein n=1 Tax=Lactuca virosa TaxID=75947 RepID=A0AAU9NSB9_9ASTR|nr:unnamed protein product [Lactuca virosa]